MFLSRLSFIEKKNLADTFQFDILRAMPRPRKTDSPYRELVEEFARTLATNLGAFVDARVGAAASLVGRARSRKRRAKVLCYYPKCKNLAAPRFGMFCAAEHKKLSKAEKERYRALHNKRAGRPVAAKRRRRRRR